MRMKKIMNTDEVLDIFREAGALLEGHFILSSGVGVQYFYKRLLFLKTQF